MAATAVALLVSGCGSTGAKSASSTTSASGSSATTTAAAAAGDQGNAFCTAARTFAAQAAAAVAGGLQNPNLPQQAAQLASQLQSITPPPEIAADWQTAVSSIQQLGQALQGTNFSDPQQAAALQAKVAPIEQQLNTAGQHIDTYLTTKCGFSAGGSSAGSAAPSS